MEATSANQAHSAANQEHRAAMWHETAAHLTEATEPPRSRGAKSPKTVSFASTVNLSLELKPSHSKDPRATLPDLSELFLLALLLLLALLAPAGQAIAHVNDIIVLYVGYSAISFLCQSPYSPMADLVSGAPSCSRRAARSRRVYST